MKQEFYKNSNLKKSCVIIAGGEVHEKIEIPENAVIICADCGYHHAQAQGIIPDVIVGDFDSCQNSDKLPDHTEIIRLPVEKDVSDTWFAVQYAMTELHCTEFHVYGTCGGERVDHMIANLQLLHYMGTQDLQTRFYYKNQILQLLKNSDFRFSGRDYPEFSVFALSKTCFVTISNVKYPLQDHKLKNTFPLGLSNCCDENSFPEISVRDGIVLLVLTKK
ncbi:MAG: thiamine diphosphokinase [Oscillospiraceae bacterium]|nr:thiamine diphosphokinase [Oscillospiraceae bacterium]